MHGESRQELERPCRFLEKGATRRWYASRESHGRGNPETGYGETLGMACELLTGRLVRPKEGEPMVYRESDQPIVLGGRESRPQGEGADGDAQP